MSGVGSFEKIFGNFTYYLFIYLLSQGATCYMLSGFRNSSLISIHIIIQLLLLSFSKYIRLRQYYEFSFILSDLRHIFSNVNCERNLRAIIARCKFIECVIGRKLVKNSTSKRKKWRFISLL